MKASGKQVYSKFLGFLSILSLQTPKLKEDMSGVLKLLSWMSETAVMSHTSQTGKFYSEPGQKAAKQQWILNITSNLQCLLLACKLVITWSAHSSPTKPCLNEKQEVFHFKARKSRWQWGWRVRLRGMEADLFQLVVLVIFVYLLVYKKNCNRSFSVFFLHTNSKVNN